MFFDTLPFPNITAKDAEERSKQTVDYLIQFKEELEFILNSIARGEYSSLSTKLTQATETQNISPSNNDLTVAEVINSAAFKGAINSVKEDIPAEVEKEVDEKLPGLVDEGLQNLKFTVNFESGNLEYTTS